MEFWDRNSEFGDRAVFFPPSGRRNDGHGSKRAKILTVEESDAEHEASWILGTQINFLHCFGRAEPLS